MAKPLGPPKPFTRGGITYPSQQAYRQALAQSKGFAGRAERDRAIKVQKQLVNKAQSLSKSQKSELAVGLADLTPASGGAMLGDFALDAPEPDRGSNRLPPRLRELIDAMGDDKYPLWRSLYA